MDLQELMMLKSVYGNTTPTKVTRSYRKGRRYRIQQIKNKNGFVVKQIIHVMNQTVFQ